MKYLIVGLGNVGEEYLETRHNIGFCIADALASKMNTSFRVERYGSIARGRIKNAEILVLKPSTYMNLSGEAVRYWIQKEKIALSNILVLVDDLSLPFSTLRLKGKGSDGGHNGLKNIANLLGSVNYSRLRFGIGSNFSRGQQIDFVLGNFSLEEKTALPLLLEQSVSIIVDFCLMGLERTMNKHNIKK